MKENEKKMKSLTVTTIIDISDEAFNVLKKIYDEGYAEFKDTQYDSYDEYFKAAMNEKWLPMSMERFNKRNFGGVKYEYINELCEANLISNVSDAWHLTYKINSLGKKMLEENESQ